MEASKSIRTPKRKLRPIAAARICFCLLASCFSSASFAASTASSADIEDVLATHHFISFTEAYNNGTDPILCVQIQNGRYAFWNPVTDTMSNEADAKCKATSSVKPLHTMIGQRPLQGFQKQFAGQDSSFDGASEIYSVDHGSSPHCGPNFEHTYDITFLDGSLYSFYFVTRRSRPREVTINTMCEYAWDDRRASYEEFYMEELLDSVDIGNGRTLISAHGDNKFGIPYALLIIRKLPSASIWASQALSAFIIPKSVLGPLLERAGGHPADRHAAVAKLLDKFASP